MNLTIRDAKLDDSWDGAALVEIIDSYARGAGGQRAPLCEHARSQLAKERGCCKITLEIHDSNRDAKRLYERAGFGPWQSPTLFVTKPL